MSDFYSKQHRQLQDLRDTHSLADRLQQIIVENQVSEQHQPFQARQDFSRKLKWGPSDFSGEKFSWRLLPSAARVRPAPAAAHNSPSVRCAPLACANDLTPCRDGLAF